MTYEPTISEGSIEPEQVKVCDVSWERLETIQGKTKWKQDFDTIVRFGDESKTAKVHVWLFCLSFKKTERRAPNRVLGY